MMWILENLEGERAVIGNWAGYQQLLALGLDCRLNRFTSERSRVVHQLPLAARSRGRDMAIAMAAEGAVYPHDGRGLAVVDSDGRRIAGPGDKILLARETGTARRTIWQVLANQARLAGVGWVVHVR